MKKLLPFLSIAFMAAACNSGPREMEVKSQQADTTGLSAFNTWKAQEAYVKMQESQAAEYLAEAPVKKQAVKKTAVRKTSSAGSNSTGSQNTSDQVVLNNESSAPAKAQKKGWSKAAKGAVIGGVAGAAGGAVINKKNRVAGAVIGAVVGAGGGYVIGRGMDKKDGRYLIQ